MTVKTKTEALTAVGQFSKLARVTIMRTDDALKITGWADKAKDAWTFLNNPAADPEETILASLMVECNERGLNETPTQLAEMQLAKSNQVRMIRAKVDGLEDRMKTAINAAPNDAAAVQIFTGAVQLAVAELGKLGIDGSAIIADL